MPFDVRPGEQALPHEGKEDCSRAAQAFVREMVPEYTDSQSAEILCAALEKRIVDFGFKKYGIRLQTGNGRDMLRDVEEEVHDAINYQMGEVLEHPGAYLSREILWKLVDVALLIQEQKRRRKVSEAVPVRH